MATKLKIYHFIFLLCFQNVQIFSFHAKFLEIPSFHFFFFLFPLIFVVIIWFLPYYFFQLQYHFWFFSKVHLVWIHSIFFSNYSNLSFIKDNSSYHSEFNSNFILIQLISKELDYYCSSKPIISIFFCCFYLFNQFF